VTRKSREKEREYLEKAKTKLTSEGVDIKKHRQVVTKLKQKMMTEEAKKEEAKSVVSV